MILYDYFRSTACYRVRLALSIKNLDYTKTEVHLLNHGGEQHHPGYQNINPQELVPSLEVDAEVLTQSLAIIEYLDEVHPNPPLLPKNPIDRAKVRALALLISCDIHPLNNLRVLNRLKSQFQADEAAIKSWYHHWLQKGFDAFEAHLKTLQRNIPVCFGDQFTLADICLIPQVYNAKRFEFDMTPYPLINQINDFCLKTDSFTDALVY